MESTRPKLVIVINDFLVGGAQRLIVELLLRFDKARFDIVLVTLMQFEEKETMYRLLPKDTQIRRLDFKGFADVSSWIALGKLLKAEQPDVVLSHLFFSNTVVRLLNMFLEYRTITVEHNTYTGNTWLQIWCDRLLSRFSRKIVAVSRAVMEFASHQQHVPLGKFIVIRNGIDVQALAQAAAAVDAPSLKRELQLAQDDTFIISVGRLTAQKNPLLLVEGFARFAQTQPNLHLVFLGDGALRAEMEMRGKALGIWKQIRFVGNVPDVSPYYAAAEFLVSTSYIEGLSMAHLEALACRLPILATRTAGSEELIEEGKSGFFITEGTPKAVAEGLTRMCRANTKEMGEHAHKVAERFDIRNTVKEYEDLLADIYGQ